MGGHVGDVEVRIEDGKENESINLETREEQRRIREE
jgi:hypothetical protein